MCYFLHNAFNFVQIDFSVVIDIHFVQPVHKGLGGKKSYTSGHALPSKSNTCNEFATHPHKSPQINTDILLSTIHKV